MDVRTSKLTTNYLFNNEKAYGWVPGIFLGPVVGLFLIIVAMLPAEILLPSLNLMTADGDFIGIQGFVAFLLSAFPLVGILVLSWVRWVERRSRDSVGLNRDRSLSHISWGLLVGILSSLWVVLSIAVMGGYELGNWFSGFESWQNIGAITLLLFCFIIQSGVEELLFRGWLFSSVTRRHSIALGMLASATLFTFLHLSPENPWYTNINSFMFSIFACYLVLLSNTVWVAMGWHAGWNWLIGTGFNIPLTGIEIDIQASIVELSPTGNDFITGGAGGPESSVACFLFFLIGSIFLHVKLIRRTNKARVLSIV
ncbi:CPBP family intramembrane glutamic endopeptidase [Pleionea litopenaei]|uniref:Type II CAAX endopeptidase family protein n=1 Tax=Pleionea litopenaei TaxID=3070815 RepID=A0AA51X6B4_9GAMM|nr:type II CAAX endopeptidase family protein [Pleionea sp. HL-JVS1]WMS85915.1 type II CAAX endopeptidase family protein [Pleionea sp. HL-JVS1]